MIVQWQNLFYHCFIHCQNLDYFLQILTEKNFNKILQRKIFPFCFLSFLWEIFMTYHVKLQAIDEFISKKQYFLWRFSSVSERNEANPNSYRLMSYLWCFVLLIIWDVHVGSSYANDFKVYSCVWQWNILRRMICWWTNRNFGMLSQKVSILICVNLKKGKDSEF